MCVFVIKERVREVGVRSLVKQEEEGDTGILGVT